jgi:hypothetical protein
MSMKGWRRRISGSDRDVLAGGPAHVLWPGLPRIGQSRSGRVILAFVLSLAAHLALLSATFPRAHRQASPGVLFVTLVGVRAADSPLPAPAQPANSDRVATLPGPPAASPPSAVQPESSVPVAAAKPQPTTAAPSSSDAKPAPARTAPNEPLAHVPAEQLDRAPAPLGSPGMDFAVQKELTGRRLLVRIWVDADGKVSRTVFVNPELSAAALAALEEAIARVRFTPGSQAGQEVGSVVRTRLCFDDAGQLESGSAECWGHQPP